MAHIPYGYRIRDGKAELVPEEAERISRFIDLYLSGISIRDAGRTAGIPRSETSLRHLLLSKVYLGDRYYPAMITPEQFDRIAAEIERRTHPGSRTPARAQPVQRSFRLKSIRKKAGKMDAQELAGYIYSLITPAPDGTALMSEKDMEKVRIWRNSLKCQ